MTDPSYVNGATPDSIVAMMEDIARVLVGQSNYVTMPVPMQGIGPATHISFKDDSDIAPKELQIKSHANSNRAGSRRSQSYNISHGISIGSSNTTNLGSKSENVEIDDILEMVTSSMSKEDVLEEVVEEVPVSNPVRTRSVSKKTDDMIIGRPATRRIAYKPSA